jgi:hypothetical protein
MPNPIFDSDTDFDAQDRAETLDEGMTLGEEGDRGGQVRTFADPEEETDFEDLPEVLDMTQAAGDRDDDEALALDADEFDPDAVEDADLEDDNELAYRAATEEREDDLDGLGPEDRFNEDQLDAREVEGLDEEVRDAGSVEGGEDDVSNFQARDVGDEDLKTMGYSEDRGGETRARPD